MSDEDFNYCHQCNKQDIQGLLSKGWRRNKSLLPVVTAAGPLTLQAQELCSIGHKSRLRGPMF
eukprot:9711375-Karenia_brevis.AAC.1